VANMVTISYVIVAYESCAPQTISAMRGLFPATSRSPTLVPGLQRDEYAENKRILLFYVIVVFRPTAYTK